MPANKTGRTKRAVKKAASKKPAAKKAPAKSPGIGRSAITGRFMSVSAAKGHKKTAIVEGAGGRKRK